MIEELMRLAGLIVLLIALFGRFSDMELDTQMGLVISSVFLLYAGTGE